MSVCIVAAVFLKSRFLAVLLCLETLVVVAVLVLVSHVELIFRVCFIAIGACERAVGLACLVIHVRHQGSSHIVI